ncbi:hypothetical protein OOK48_35110 [Streptomyces viridodiastaticus]|uniref:hypothetical protein n=1 Tax=Streptomyces albogriseolus TaxID=1887 RepID=UPI0022592EDF|nr:hypothetical protein [Streptomyces viridodiastaticus]MCX4571552.1 hypothetical protein [Streptomyces viridodiastaticus]
MALRPEDKKRVEQLKEAAAFLRDGGKEPQASAVEYLLSPEGTAFVNRLRIERLRQETAEGKYGQNLSIAMPFAVRKDIKTNVARAAAEAQRKEKELAAAEDREPKKVSVSIPAEAERALEAFLAGKFVPEKPKRAARGSAEKTVNLNVRVDPKLRQRAEDFGADHAAQFGFAPRASHVIASWLIQRFTEAGS